MYFRAIAIGVNFGLTSGVITTLGLMVGLHSGTNSMLAVVGGIVTIAIADSLSDALGIHISKEAEAVISKRELWIATLSTFLAKMVMALSFVIPVLLFDLSTAIIVGIAWGMLVLATLSFRLARANDEAPFPVIGEHLGIAILVIIATHYIGEIISSMFT